VPLGQCGAQSGVEIRHASKMDCAAGLS